MGQQKTDHGILDYLVVTNIDWLNGLDADIRDQFFDHFLMRLLNFEMQSPMQSTKQIDKQLLMLVVKCVL